MKRLCLLGCLSVACVSGAPPVESSGDASAKVVSSPSGASRLGPEPDLAEARFFARPPGTDAKWSLKLAAFSVEVEAGTHATRSRLDISVENPSNEQVEAVLRLPIPPGAAVTRAVLYVGDRPMEGAFVARDRARDIYRAITERRRDPALITWHGPDWIDLSIFPVEGHKQRRIQLEWIEPTAIASKTVWYRIPVIAHEGKAIARPDNLTVGGAAIARLGRTWLPIVEMRPPVAAAARLPGDPFGYVFSPAEPPSGDPLRLVLIAETSAAMSREERARQRDTLNALVAALPASARLSLLAADFTVQTLAEVQAPDQMEPALARLDGIASAGAMDMQYALDKASELGRALASRHIVFLGRGLASFDGDAFSAPLRGLQDARQTLVAVGTDEHALALRDVAALTGGLSVAWSQAVAAPSRLLWGITQPPASQAMANAERFFPLETVTGETRWLARFVGEAPSGVAAAPARDLEALWARAHVVGTTSRESDEGERHRVLTPLTSLLVLETTADYARWGIPAPESQDEAGKAAKQPVRNSGILGVMKQGSGSHVTSIFGRDSAVNGATENTLGGLIGNQIQEAYGVGGLRLVGTGSGGGGTGEGTLGLGNFGTIGKGGGSGSGYGRGAGGLGGRRSRAPEVVPGPASVRGSLDKEIIRRVIRLHMNEVKFCYETELVQGRELSGRIAVQFTIAATGEVIASVLQSSTMGNTRVENCVVQAVRRWSFPKPTGGGIVVVSYPFNFVAPSDQDWYKNGYRGEATPWFQPSPPKPPSRISPLPAPQVPKDPWDIALAQFRALGDLKVRVAKIAQTLEVPPTETPALLAWSLVERKLRAGWQPMTAHFLVAALLREAGQPLDAVRLLSEMAPQDLDRVQSVFRRWGRKDEADRLKSRLPPVH